MIGRQVANLPTGNTGNRRHPPGRRAPEFLSVDSFDRTERAAREGCTLTVALPMPVIVSISAKFFSFMKRKKKTRRWLGERSSAIAFQTSFTSCFAIRHRSGELGGSGIGVALGGEGDPGGRLLASRIRLLAIPISHVSGEQAPRKRSHAWYARRKQSCVTSSATSGFLSDPSAKRKTLVRWLAANSANSSARRWSLMSCAISLSRSLRGIRVPDGRGSCPCGPGGPPPKRLVLRGAFDVVDDVVSLRPVGRLELHTHAFQRRQDGRAGRNIGMGEHPLGHEGRKVPRRRFVVRKLQMECVQRRDPGLIEDMAV